MDDQLKKWIEYNEERVFDTISEMKNSFNNWMRNFKPEKQKQPKSTTIAVFDKNEFNLEDK